MSVDLSARGAGGQIFLKFVLADMWKSPYTTKCKNVSIYLFLEAGCVILWEVFLPSPVQDLADFVAEIRFGQPSLRPARVEALADMPHDQVESLQADNTRRIAILPSTTNRVTVREMSQQSGEYQAQAAVQAHAGLKHESYTSEGKMVSENIKIIKQIHTGRAQ